MYIASHYALNAQVSMKIKFQPYFCFQASFDCGLLLVLMLNVLNYMSSACKIYVAHNQSEIRFSKYPTFPARSVVQCQLHVCNVRHPKFYLTYEETYVQLFLPTQYEHSFRYLLPIQLQQNIFLLVETISQHNVQQLLRVAKFFIVQA